MAAKISDMGHGLMFFHCPGCGYGHNPRVRGTTLDAKYIEEYKKETGREPPTWEWNGSMDAPTFSPSILVFGSDPARRCHSYVTDGKIQFLDDCFHALKGQTVELPDYDE